MKASVSEEMVVQIGETDPMYDDTFTVYPPTLTRKELEDVVIFERLRLYNSTNPYGAAALRRQLQYLGVEQLPSVSTINRIISKHCLTNGHTGYYPEDHR